MQLGFKLLVAMPARPGFDMYCGPGMAFQEQGACTYVFGVNLQDACKEDIQ